MENIGIVGVGAITVICYLIGEATKASGLNNKWIPIVCGVMGGAAVPGAGLVPSATGSGLKITESGHSDTLVTVSHANGKANNDSATVGQMNLALNNYVTKEDFNKADLNIPSWYTERWLEQKLSANSNNIIIYPGYGLGVGTYLVSAAPMESAAGVYPKGSVGGVVILQPFAATQSITLQQPVGWSFSNILDNGFSVSVGSAGLVLSTTKI